jgi:hypothetical protein
MGVSVSAQSDLTVAPVAGTKVGRLDATKLTAATIKGNTSYAGKNQSTLTVEELALMMASTGFFNIEEIATFVGIAERESNLRPFAFNDSEALGLWQIIFKSGNWISAGLPILVGSSPALNGKTIPGWKLRNKNSTKKLSLDEMKKDNWTGQLVDEVFWYPFNQIAILAWQVEKYTTQPGYKDGGKRSASQSLIWGNWGDGYWGRSHGGMDNNQNFPYGALSGVKPSTVKKAYEALGGTWVVYQAWALTALVDGYKDFPSPRSNEAVEKLRDGTKYKAATYRNYWDVYIWVNFETYKNTFFKDNAISTEAAGGVKMRYSRWGADEFCYPLGKTSERQLYAAEATVGNAYVDPAPAANIIKLNQNRTDASGRSGQ